MYLTKKNIKIIIIAAIVLVVAFAIKTAFDKVKYYLDHTIECSIQEDAANGGVKINTSMLELLDKNIEFGDCLDVLFSNGYEANEVALYNGDFSNSGTHILKELDNGDVIFKIQNEDSIWEVANLKSDDTVKLTLSGKSKYAFVYEAFNTIKLQEPDDYSGTEEFANFRAMYGGNLKEDKFYRSACPYSQNADRAAAVNKMYQFYDINHFVDLSQADPTYSQVINENRSSNSYFINRVKSTNGLCVDAEGISSINIKKKDCNSKIISSLLKLAKNNVDRMCFFSYKDDDITGYFCVLVNAIAGATYEEIVDQYMESYISYYDFDKIETPHLYNAVKDCHIDWFLHKLSKTPGNYDLKKVDYAYSAEMYLRSCGVSNEDYLLIKSYFTS